MLTRIKPKKEKIKNSKEKVSKKGKKEKLGREVKYETTIEEKNETEECESQWLSREEIQELIRS